MNDTQVIIEGVLEQIRSEIRAIAEIYDSRDLFGIAYGKFADKIIEETIDKYLE